MVKDFGAKARQRAGALAVDGFFHGVSRIAKLHPYAKPERHDVGIVRDVPYQDSRDRAHLLDIYRPLHRKGPRPVVFYVHGGGFRILSKDTHWLMGLAFARRGYLVFNVSYRLAPEHPYPAAIEDVFAAYRWVVDHAAAFGGDTSRMIVAGESAGANLVTSLTLALSRRREEPFAREVFDRGVRPLCALPACGLFQVSNIERFWTRRRLSPFIADRLREVSDAYLAHAPEGVSRDLADPLVVLERGDSLDHPLPPFFLPVGTKDPLLDDTRRLAKALRARGVEVDDQYYPGELHAFHAFVVLENARRCWQDTYRFLDLHAPADQPARAPSPP